MSFFKNNLFAKKLASARVLLGASLLVLSPALSWAQTSIVQDFETSTISAGTFPFKATTLVGDPGSIYFGSTNQFGNNVNPTSTSVALGTRAFGVVNNGNSNTYSTQLDFGSIYLTNSANSSISFRLAAFGLGNNQGLTSAGSVTLSLATNNSAVYRTAVTVTGPDSRQAGMRPAIWTYNTTPEVSASTNFGSPLTVTVPGANGPSTSGGGASTITVNFPNSGVTQVNIRITINASINTALLVDNVTVSSTSPLPVELVRFTAKAQEKNVALHWITASEKNSDYFEVQRSTNGATFNAIGKVQGEGTTSSISNYLFTDRAPVTGLAYYRLRQVDFDGTESYSPVQTITWQGGSVASFYPNPSAESITFTGAEGPLHYRIYNANGQQIAVGEAESGNPVDLRTVPAGIYLLELSNKGQRSVQRFVRL